MDKDGLLLFLLDFYCKSNNLADKYSDIVSFLRSKKVIGEDVSTFIVPSFLDSIPNKILFPANFVLEEQIGSGSFGTIMKVFNRLDQQNYALKIIENEEEMEEDKFLREIRLLSYLDHPNIVRYHTSWSDSNKLFYIMELCDYNLSKFIETRQNIEDTKNKDIFKQMVNGISYIHGKGILHRDLTTNNILLKNNIVKIADFGLSVKKDNPKQITMGSDEYGTISYLAPECLQSNYYSIFTDYYAIGIILYLMYNNFTTQMEKYKSLEQLRDKKQIPITLKEEFPNISKVILNLLEPEPTKRIILEF